jgi:hypothetical protein
MKSIVSVLAVSTLALGAFAYVTRAAQDAADPAAMAEMMRLAQPGPEHEELARYAGEWDVEMTFTMPGAPPMQAKARAVAASILGKRFLEIDTQGSMMGMSMQSKSLLGFDRRHGRWTSVGFDTMGTYWVSGQGVREADGVARLHGVDDDPKGKQVYTFELKFVSADEFTFDVVFTQLGEARFDPPHRMAQLRYTRRS